MFSIIFVGMVEMAEEELLAANSQFNAMHFIGTLLSASSLLAGSLLA